MALNTKQTVSLNGDSTIGGQMIASFNAQIPQGDGNSSVNLNIINQALYDLNRKEVRKDQADFQAKVYEIEDNLSES